MKRLLPLAALSLLAACVNTPADDRLEEAVRATIRQHPALLAEHLTVRCENGVIYVRGTVPTQVELAEIDQVLKETAGVTKSVNLASVDNTRF